MFEAKNSFFDFVAAGGIPRVSQTHLDFSMCAIFAIEMLPVETYSTAYFSLCVFLAITGSLQTMRKLYPPKNFQITCIVLSF